MARVPSKHDRDHNLDWELSLKDKDKKLKSQPDVEKMEPIKLKNASRNSSTLRVSGRSRKTEELGSGNSQKIGVVGVDRSNMDKSTSVNHPSTRIVRDENYLKKYDAELLKKVSASLKGPTQGELKELKLDNSTKSTPKISETTRVTATKIESPEEVAPEILQQLRSKYCLLKAFEKTRQLNQPSSSIPSNSIDRSIDHYSLEPFLSRYSKKRKEKKRKMAGAPPGTAKMIIKEIVYASVLGFICAGAWKYTYHHNLTKRTKSFYSMLDKDEISVVVSED
ncbi:hypothetical protein M8C21_015108 [Ambrosia artemisiifolia]|uniref:Uncharacterized protein n=1 Tax=Ambrosia artemisiifolia TaxID=4212 RepID=A0AAD5C385_AMBAR|nr:hypothetical protein M8C21_015108 [Ambrosia artemisiifolia]